MSISYIPQGDEQYPQLLAETHSAPAGLHVAGELAQGIPLVAIVGSRKPTHYGRAVTQQLSRDLAEAGIGIVSGLALGIDAIAHQGALEVEGYTVAVLANGLDRMYPTTNRDLGIKILKRNGAIISEYSEGTPPLKQHFPARNRIVAGMVEAVIVTEAAQKSGSLITANFALEENRQVMAVPGSILSPMSAGTNNLIKAGAAPVMEAADVLEALNLSATARQSPPSAASPEEQAILELIDAGTTDKDELIARLEWDAATFNQTITLMEISGKVRNVGGGTWLRM